MRTRTARALSWGSRGVARCVACTVTAPGRPDVKGTTAMPDFPVGDRVSVTSRLATRPPLR